VSREPLRLAGAAGLRSLQEAEGWFREVLRPDGRECKSAIPYLLGVRRFSNPAWQRGRLYGDGGVAFSLLDIGDAIERTAQQSVHGDAAVLLRGAADVLGHAVRDAGIVRQLLADLPIQATVYRYGAVVALGALGELPCPSTVLSDPHDRAGAEAYALAVGLAPCPAEERVANLRRMDRHLSRALRVLTATMAGRAAEGDAIGIMM
jgi:hypothetical protein